MNIALGKLLPCIFLCVEAIRRTERPVRYGLEFLWAGRPSGGEARRVGCSASEAWRRGERELVFTTEALEIRCIPRPNV